MRAQAASIPSRRIAMLHHPLTFIRTALDAGAPAGFKMAIDPGTGLPSSVSSLVDYPNLGNAVVRTRREAGHRTTF